MLYVWNFISFMMYAWNFVYCATAVLAKKVLYSRYFYVNEAFPG